MFLIGHTNGIPVEDSAGTWCEPGRYENDTHLYEKPGVFKILFKGMTREDYLVASAQLKTFGVTWFVSLQRLESGCENTCSKSEQLYHYGKSFR